MVIHLKLHNVIVASIGGEVMLGVLSDAFLQPTVQDLLEEVAVDAAGFLRRRAALRGREGLPGVCCRGFVGVFSSSPGSLLFPRSRSSSMSSSVDFARGVEKGSVGGGERRGLGRGIVSSRCASAFR